MSTRIIIDSTTDMVKEIKDKFLIVPLTVRFGEEEYIDGVTMNYKQFYEKLIECDDLPTTSQATPNDFSKIYEQVIADGDDAVVVSLSSKLSGTCQSAVIAAKEYEGRIFVVDSESATIGTAILAEYALSLAEKGMSAADIAKELEVQRKRVCIVAMLDTLEYLKRGGRISKTVAFAGTVLSIKPVIALKLGEIEILGKARGSKQGNNLLVSEIEKAGGVDFNMPVMLGYSGLSDALLQKYIEDSRALWEESYAPLRQNCIGSVIGTHVGPGAIAAAFFKKGN